MVVSGVACFCAGMEACMFGGGMARAWGMTRCTKAGGTRGWAGKAAAGACIATTDPGCGKVVSFGTGMECWTGMASSWATG